MQQQLLHLLAIHLLVGTTLSTPTAPVIRLVDTVSRPSRAELEAECGALGVMEVPEGANPLEYRHCLEHPSFLEEPTTVNRAVEAMACLKYPGSRGCDTTGRSSSGYHQHWCWRGCGTPSQLNAGYWCWLAWNGGKGDWVGCTSGAVEDRYPNQELCNQAMTQGASCGVGDCGACGCSC